MAALQVVHDPEGRTLTVLFDDPEKEQVAEETGDEVILIKYREGQVIGFERLNYTLSAGEILTVDSATA